MATRKTTKKKAEENPAEIIEVKAEAQAKPKKVTRRKPAKKAPKEPVVVTEMEEKAPVVAEPQPQLEAKPEAKEKPEAKLKPEAKEKQDPKQQPKAKPQPEAKERPQAQQRQEVQKPLPLPNITIHNIIELQQAPMRAIVVNDQQMQMLTMEEIEKRHRFLQETLTNVLDYDVVISDTNMWLELLLGKPQPNQPATPLGANAKLQYERQLEFISKFCTYRGGRFMMMAETYEEIDRFACLMEPQNHKEADFSDNIVYLNAAARMAKRLILQQQRENRLHIEGIGSESHHASFADPAIIRRVAELFAAGKKVLLLTNDASVAIRAMGICDDLQRHNNISDEDWKKQYAPLRPMVFTFDDLRLLENYTRQYHFIQIASGQSWMCDVEPAMHRAEVAPLTLCEESFAAGDKRKTDNLFPERLMQGQMMLDAEEQQSNKSQQKSEQKQKPKRHKPQPRKAE